MPPVPPLAVEITGPVTFGLLSGLLVLFLLIDLRFFAPGREPTFREGAVWSVGWLVLSLLAAVVVWVVDDDAAAVTYTTVYLIERSLSLDNLFVFLLLFRYFGVPQPLRGRLLFSGIVGALVLRGLAILGGVALIERFDWVIYVLAAGLLVLAYRILRGVDESVDPETTLAVRAVRALFPVTRGYRAKHWFVRESGRLHVTPLFLCLSGVIAADIAFAIDSIPAAFAITRDPALIWMGNLFALLGLRALFVLVDALIQRFRYLDETIAVVLALVAVKLLTEDILHLGAGHSLAIVAGAFAIGIAASLLGDRRAAGPDGADGEADARPAPASGDGRAGEPAGVASGQEARAGDGQADARPGDERA